MEERRPACGRLNDGIGLFMLAAIKAEVPASDRGVYDGILRCRASADRVALGSTVEGRLGVYADATGAIRQGHATMLVNKDVFASMTYSSGVFSCATLPLFWRNSVLTLHKVR